MGQLFGGQSKKKCCCNGTTDICNPCPPGTIYPWAVDVSFPSLGVTQPAGNELDPDEDGEATFLYRVEGSYGGYSFQCTFGECDVSVSIVRDSDGATICIGGGATAMVGSSCPPDPLILIYTVECAGGGTLSVVITG